jgi:predicted ABC-type ATPase
VFAGPNGSGKSTIPRFAALCDEFWLFDNTDEPCVLAYRDTQVTEIRPNAYWSEVAIHGLMN